MSNFIQDCLEGKALLEDIDDYVDAWHEEESDRSLSEYLGMSKKEYAYWATNPDVLPLIITGRVQKKDPRELVEGQIMQLAARAATVKKARQLERWLQRQGYYDND